jgi:hypothetical protein
VLDPDHAWEPDEARRWRARDFIENVLSSAGSTFRQFKNTLVFALPTAEGVRVIKDTAVRLLALEGIYRQYRGGGLSETQMDDLRTRLDQARKGLPGAVWGAYTVTIAPSGVTSDGQHLELAKESTPGTTLWVRQEHGFPGYRPGEHSVAERVWKRLMDDQRLLDRLDPRLISQGKGDQWRLWLAEDERINVATLWDYFCRFPYLPMLTGSEALAQTIAWGVQRGLFAYALGDGETFDTVHFHESLPSGHFAIIEGAWLLRPALAERLLKPEVEEVPAPPPIPPRPLEIEGERTGDQIVTPVPTPPVAPAPPPAVYKHITIETPVDWRQWYDFYQAVIKPLAETGAQVHLRLHLEASGEIDANLIDLSVKESVLQFNPQGKVDVEG